MKYISKVLLFTSLGWSSAILFASLVYLVILGGYGVASIVKPVSFEAMTLSIDNIQQLAIIGYIGAVIGTILGIFVASN